MILLINGNTKSDVRIQSNDAVVIKPVGKTVKLQGAVKNQAIYELKEGETFSNLIKFCFRVFKSLPIKIKLLLSSLMINGERIFKNFTYEDIIDSETSKMEMKYLFINFPNTPRNIVKIIGEIGKYWIYSI